MLIHLPKQAVKIVVSGVQCPPFSREVGCLGREVEKRRFRPDKVHWSADEEAMPPLAGEAEALKNTLSAFHSLNADLHKRLVGEMSAGIGAEQMDMDVDFD